MSARLEGEREFVNALKKLEKSVAEEMTKATEAGGEVIRQEMKSRIHDVSGDLSSSLQVIRRRGRPGEWSGVRVAAVPPKGAHAHLVEFGHRQVTKSGKVVGTVPPHPFARRALRAKKGVAIAVIEERLRRAIEKVTQ